MATPGTVDGKYVRVERRKVIIEMSFRSPDRATAPRHHRRERDREDETVQRMKREGMFV